MGFRHVPSTNEQRPMGTSSHWLVTRCLKTIPLINQQAGDTVKKKEDYFCSATVIKNIFCRY